MSVFISALSTTTSLAGGTFNSGYILTDRSAVVGSTVSSDSNLTFNFHWSNDGLSDILVESESVTAGTPVNYFSPIKAKYLEIELIDLGANSSLVLQSFFMDIAAGVLAIRNLGSGAPILNLGKIGARSLTSSDSSIAISNTAAEIDITTAHNTIAPINSDVQVNSVAGGYEIGVGQALTDSIVISGQASYSGSTGASNVLISPGTGTFNVDTDRNVAVGVQAGRQPNTGGSDCIAVGYQSGQTSQGERASDGVYGRNVAIGSQSQYTLAKAGAISIGYQAGYNSTHQYSISIGYQANGSIMSNGGSSIAIGANANAQSSSTIAIGVDCIASNTDQVCIGRDVAPTGSDVTVVGANAGSLAAFNSSCFGKLSGTNCNESSTNIGYQAGDTGGAKATNIGRNAGASSGGSSVCVGFQSGNSCGQYSVCLGRGAGGNSGNRGISIGYNAGNTNPTPSDAIVLGSGCNPASNVNGRLYFGNSMEAVHGSFSMPNSGVPQAYIKLEWNGTLYYIPAFTTAPT